MSDLYENPENKKERMFNYKVVFLMCAILGYFSGALVALIIVISTK